MAMTAVRSTSQRVLYASPGEEWRISAMFLVQDIYDSLGGWHFDLQIVIGSLLGYERQDIDEFISRLKPRGS